MTITSTKVGKNVKLSFCGSKAEMGELGSLLDCWPVACVAEQRGLNFDEATRALHCRGVIICHRGDWSRGLLAKD